MTANTATPRTSNAGPAATTALIAALIAALTAGTASGQSIGAPVPGQDDASTLGSAVGAAPSQQNTGPYRLAQPLGNGTVSANSHVDVPSGPFVPTRAPLPPATFTGN